MTKKDIEEGSIVLLRDGRTCMVMPSFFDGNRLMLYGRQYWHREVSSVTSLDNYTDDLINFDGFKTLDIMAVKITFEGLSFTNINIVFKALFSLIDPDKISWTWKREEVKELTMKELEEKFGCKVKIVKEEN